MFKSNQSITLNSIVIPHQENINVSVLYLLKEISWGEHWCTPCRVCTLHVHSITVEPLIHVPLERCSEN